MSVPNCSLKTLLVNHILPNTGKQMLVILLSRFHQFSGLARGILPHGRTTGGRWGRYWCYKCPCWQESHLWWYALKAQLWFGPIEAIWSTHSTKWSLKVSLSIFWGFGVHLCCTSHSWNRVARTQAPPIILGIAATIVATCNAFLICISGVYIEFVALTVILKNEK